jgi:3-oxoacyl-[acyl-carrier protein] reductase
MEAALRGKVAIVTGASRGIGRAIAERLAGHGASVVINHRQSAAQAADPAATIEKAGGKAAVVQADMASVNDVRRLIRSAVERFARLDILVNNAAIGVAEPFAEVTEDRFNETFAVNIRGPFFAIQEAVPHMKDGGRIINISSVGTRLTQAGAQLAVYHASKSALEQLAHVFAKELGPRGITINSVLPGLVDTELAAQVPPASRALIVQRTALGRIGTPEDIADVVVFLASGAGRWITGQAISASGGLE